MGYQIIREDAPDRYALFCSNIDQFVYRSATAKNIVDFFDRLTHDQHVHAVQRIVAQFSAGEEPYPGFTLTLEEALQKHRAHGGEPELDTPDAAEEVTSG